MRLRKIIKSFLFTEDKRSDLTLGAKTRLDPVAHCLALELDSSGSYSTDADLNIKTWVANPTSVKQWSGFEVRVTHPKIDGQIFTSLGFRLSDGINQRWWNGASWVIDTAHWNTEAEVAANISSFPATNLKLQVVINLKTTDVRITPLVYEVKVLYKSDIEFQEDIVYRSLVPLLKSEIRPRGRHQFVMLATGSTIDLDDDYPIETPYNVVDIDAVFNHTDDPLHLTDLFSSFNSTTQIITLGSSISKDKQVWVDFLWEPEVAVTTSQDYSEVEKVPSIVLDDINLVDARDLPLGGSVVNKNAGTGVKISAPLRGDLDILMHMICDKSIDLMRLADEVKRFFANNSSLRSVGLDEKYRLWLLSEFDMTTAANREDIRSGRLRFRIVGVLFYERDAEDIYTVKKLHLTGDMDVIAE